MKILKSAAIVGLLLIILPSAATFAGDDETPKPTYNGTWSLNNKLSEKPVAPAGRGSGARAGGRSGMQSGSMAGRGRGRGGGMSGSMGQPSGGERPGNMAAKTIDRRPDIAVGNEQLVIFHEGAEFAVTNAMDISQTVYTDGRNTTRWSARGQVEESARVGEDGIVVKSFGKQDPSHVVTYILSKDGNRLTVLHVFSPPNRDEKVRRTLVYDRIR